MPIQPCRSIFLCVGLLMLSALAAASNISFLRDAPITHFSQQDEEIFIQALESTLSNAPDGATRNWSNPKSTANGQLKVLQTFQQNAQRCRTLSIQNHAEGRSSEVEYDFCEVAPGEWKVPPTSPVPPQK